MMAAASMERGAFSHLPIILAGVEDVVGPLARETLTSVVGFDEGGPVSIIEAACGGVYVTTELHDIIDQFPSDEGRHYELGLVTDKGASFAQQALSALGRHCLDGSISDGATVVLSVDEFPPDGISGTAHMIGSSRGDCGCYMIVPNGQEFPGAKA